MNEKKIAFDRMFWALKDLEKVGMSIRANSVIWKDIRDAIELAELSKRKEK